MDRRRAELPGLTRAPLLDTPAKALNQAFTWAVRRNPAGVRADPGGIGEWHDDQVQDLLESAERFRRVGSGAKLDPAHFLREVVGGLFGVRADAPGGRFAIAPWVPEFWRSMALRRLRCYRTILDIEVRIRAEWVTVRLERSFGPAIPVAVTVRNRASITQVTVDETAVQGDRAVLTLQQQHEVTFFHQGMQ